MAKSSISKGVIKDIIIVAIGVLAIWVGLQAAFGTQNPFYVVASESMVPVLKVYDVLIVQGHEPFKDIKTGDIIVFDRPSDHDRVIVHRVASIIDEEPRALRTKGDANPASIPGTDFPITEKEYIGKVVYILPQVGYVTQLIQPPVNYVIIAVIVGIMIIKQMTKRRKEHPLSDPSKSDAAEESAQKEPEEFPGIEKIEKDSEYSEHTEKSDIAEKKGEPAREESGEKEHKDKKE